MIQGYSQMCPQYLLQDAYLEYGIKPYSSFNHLQLRQSQLTEQTVVFLLATFPFVRHLELVQLAFERNLSPVFALLSGLSGTLTSLSLYHERNPQITYWSNAASPASMCSHHRAWARNHLRDLREAANALFSQLSLETFPALRHLTLVDLTMYDSVPRVAQNRNQITKSPIPSFSHLASFHFVRPFDPNNLLLQSFTLSAPWPNLRALTLESKQVNIVQYLIDNYNPNIVRSIFSQLNHLTISSIFTDVPRMITQFCTATRLSTLYLHDAEQRLVELLNSQTLTQLPNLTYLRLNFDLSLVSRQWNNPRDLANLTKCPPLPQVRLLHLENADIIHNVTTVAPIFGRLFPYLEVLRLERDSRQLGAACNQCRETGNRLSLTCQTRLTRAFAPDSRLNSSLFQTLQAIAIQVKVIFPSETFMLSKPELLDHFQVWSPQTREWTSERASL